MDGEWVPTFPNATYLVPRVDRDYFDPINEHRRPAARTDADQLRRRGSHLVFADSVAPVLDQATVTLWEDHHDIDEHLTLRPRARAHTRFVDAEPDLRRRPGAVRRRHPAQPGSDRRPDANSCFCEDPAKARATRHRVLAEAADTNALLFPAHFPGHGAVGIRRRGTTFTTGAWAGFDRI